MNQNEEMELVATTFFNNEYYEQTPTGMQIRHMITPDPALIPVTELLRGDDGILVFDENGDPVMVAKLDENGDPVMQPAPLILGELETIAAYRVRVGI